MGKVGSTILTFLLSIPVTAIGFMAIFGVPQVAALNASPTNELVIRDPFAQDPWGNWQQPTQPQSATGTTQQPWGQPQSQPANDAPNWGNPPSEMPAGGQQQGQPWGTTPSHPAQAPPQNPANPFNNRITSTVSHEPAGYGTTSAPTLHANSNTTVASNTPSPSATAFGMAGNSAGLNSSPASTANTTPNPFAAGLRERTGSQRPEETSAQMLNWHQASARLAELGIENYHLERGHQEGSFLFVCIYQPAETPQVTHRFEAEGGDPLMAVNQVLNKVDGWLQQQYRANLMIGGTRF